MLVGPTAVPHYIRKFLFSASLRSRCTAEEGIFPGNFPWVAPYCCFAYHPLVSSPLNTTQCVLAAGDVCPTGFYANGTVEETADCVPCNACEAGEGAAVPCGNHSDTVCEPCAEGHFSKLTSSGRECAECRFCTPGRMEAAPCTPARDRVCGSCSGGFFLFVDHTGSECLPCSECPADGEVVRWADCAAAGEPEDNRCAPGTQL